MKQLTLNDEHFGYIVELLQEASAAWHKDNPEACFEDEILLAIQNNTKEVIL